MNPAGEPVDDEIAYMWAHPPRCLGAHAREATGELRDFLVDQLGDHATVFSTRCRCGCRFVSVNGSADCGTARITCSECGDERVVFDGSRHGYDGELGNYPSEAALAAPAYHCSACASVTHEVALAFQYSGETDILAEEDAPDVQPEDLFGWLMVGAQCQACGTLGLVVDCECA